MPRKLKLDDLHRIILSTASQRDDGSVLPTVEGIAADTDRIAAAMADLLRHTLIVEVATTGTPFWREEGDTRFALVLTDAGSAAIGVSDTQEPDGAASDAALQPAPTAGPVPSKTATVVALLQRDGGATLPDLVAATGWLPHTTRAALTGLRKKGYAIDKTKVDGVTAYCIVAVA